MRSFRSVEDWPGTWVAGFSNVGAGAGRNVLIYLMRVSQAYESHYDLWKALPRKVRRAKEADKKCNVFGDIYRPRNPGTREYIFCASKYHEPCESHSHEDGWANDVNYRYRRRASLLLGDVKCSFVWDQPEVIYHKAMGRGQRRHSVGDFLDNYLSEGGR